MMHCENIYYKMNIETNSHHRSKKKVLVGMDLSWNGFIVGFCSCFAWSCHA
jgi:hypothetical protein